MSQTVVVGEAERERRTENRINAVVRHCRIGKITVKAVYPRYPFQGLPPYEIGSPWLPSIVKPQPLQWWQNPICSEIAS